MRKIMAFSLVVMFLLQSTPVQASDTGELYLRLQNGFEEMIKEDTGMKATANVYDIRDTSNPIFTGSFAADDDFDVAISVGGSFIQEAIESGLDITTVPDTFEIRIVDNEFYGLFYPFLFDEFEASVSKKGFELTDEVFASNPDIQLYLDVKEAILKSDNVGTRDLPAHWVSLDVEEMIETKYFKEQRELGEYEALFNKPSDDELLDALREGFSEIDINDVPPARFIGNRKGNDMYAMIEGRDVLLITFAGTSDRLLSVFGYADTGFAMKIDIEQDDVNVRAPRDAADLTDSVLEAFAMEEFRSVESSARFFQASLGWHPDYSDGNYRGVCTDYLVERFQNRTNPSLAETYKVACNDAASYYVAQITVPFQPKDRYVCFDSEDVVMERDTQLRSSDRRCEE